jgi:hypothetical protein
VKFWSGQKAIHTVAIKLDGIQAMLRDGQPVSRNGTPLHNIDPEHLVEGRRYEVFLGSFKETNSVLRTHDHVRKVRKDEVYEIWPGTDRRLLLPLDSDIERTFLEVTAKGGEGLVIDQTYKLKRFETYDVRITGFVPGTGRNTGKIGAFITERGNVPIQSNAVRNMPWKIGDLIEVGCMELTPDGKFRMGRFIRPRWDKDEVSETLD